MLQCCVGMYYDHGKSLTDDGDDFNDDYIGTYVFTGTFITSLQTNRLSLLNNSYAWHHKSDIGAVGTFTYLVWGM